jgi:hypothetical protein
MEKAHAELEQRRVSKLGKQLPAIHFFEHPHHAHAALQLIAPVRAELRHELVVRVVLKGPHHHHLHLQVILHRPL